MKTFLLTLLSVSLIFMSSCKNDDTPDPDNVYTLNLDGDNFASPFLLDGTFEAAVRLIPNSFGEAAGGKLFEVEVYIFEIPQNLQVKIYRSSINNEPVDMLLQQDATLGLEAQAWNTISLSDSIDVVADQDLWISMRFTQGENQRIIGCDIGPAVPNGDWFFDTDQSARIWQTYREASNGGVDINWNIRGKVVN